MGKLKDHYILVIGLACSIVSCLVPGLLFTHNVIIILSVLVVSLSASYVKHERDRLRVKKQHEQELSTLNKHYMDTKTNHIALAKQFTSKNSIIQQYRDASFITKNMLYIALSNSKEAKIREIINAITLLFDNIDREDEM